MPKVTGPVIDRAKFRCAVREYTERTGSTKESISRAVYQRKDFVSDLTNPKYQGRKAPTAAFNGVCEIIGVNPKAFYVREEPEVKVSKPEPESNVDDKRYFPFIFITDEDMNKEFAINANSIEHYSKDDSGCTVIHTKAGTFRTVLDFETITACVEAVLNIRRRY